MPKRKTPARNLKLQVKALAQDVAELRAALQLADQARISGDAILSAQLTWAQMQRESFDAATGPVEQALTARAAGDA